jgi:hypothetical protein
VSLTRAEADQVVKEAVEQGWESDRRIVKTGDGENDWYNEGYGRVELHDWDEINRVREELGNGRLPGEGCSVELKWPGILGPEYWIDERDDWRKLKAKVDELQEIVHQALERGWHRPPCRRPHKVGKHGMMIEVMPPGGKSYRPVRVGGR